MGRFWVLVLCLAPLIGCGEKNQPAPPAKEDPPPQKAAPPPEEPEKTPEEIAAEQKAEREKRIKELLGEIRDTEKPNQERWFALMKLKDVDPFPEETIDMCLELLEADTGESPDHPPLGKAALHLILESAEEFQAKAAPAIIEAAGDPKKIGLLKADLLVALPKVAKPDAGVPILIASLKDDMNHNIARGCLVEYGKPAVPALLEAVKTFQPGMARGLAMRALGKIGKDAVPAIPLLIEVLKTGGREDLGPAAEALGEFGPLAKEALPALKAVADQGMFGARDAKAAMEKIDK